MNPESKYPELKQMKPNEMFIEWAYIVCNWNHVRKTKVIKLQVCKIIPKKERNEFVKKLEEKYNAEFVNLATITK